MISKWMRWDKICYDLTLSRTLSGPWLDFNKLEWRKTNLFFLKSCGADHGTPAAHDIARRFFSPRNRVDRTLFYIIVASLFLFPYFSLIWFLISAKSDLESVLDLALSKYAEPSIWYCQISEQVSKMLPLVGFHLYFQHEDVDVQLRKRYSSSSFFLWLVRKVVLHR